VLRGIGNAVTIAVPSRDPHYRRMKLDICSLIVAAGNEVPADIC
jgi:hypothetical protein